LGSFPLPAFPVSSHLTLFMSFPDLTQSVYLVSPCLNGTPVFHIWQQWLDFDALFLSSLSSMHFCLWYCSLYGLLYIYCLFLRKYLRVVSNLCLAFFSQLSRSAGTFPRLPCPLPKTSLDTYCADQTFNASTPRSTRSAFPSHFASRPESHARLLSATVPHPNWRTLFGLPMTPTTFFIPCFNTPLCFCPSSHPPIQVTRSGMAWRALQGLLFLQWTCPLCVSIL